MTREEGGQSSAARAGTREEGGQSSEARAGAVRPGHELDLVALRAYFDEHAAANLPGYDPTARPHLHARQFGAGQSNPTFLLEIAQRGRTDPLHFVLRKRPNTVKVASAHQVAREYRVLAALHGTAVPVPRVFLLCEDARVLGASFYVMEFVQGRIFDDPLLPGLEPPQRARCYRATMQVLAALHAVDWRALPGLGEVFQPRTGTTGTSPSRPAAGAGTCKAPRGFWARMLRRLSQISDQQAQDAAPIPDKDLLVQRLGRVLVAPIRDESDVALGDGVLVHGDFKLDNVVFSHDGLRVVAVLDWELCTIGHPMADVANCAMAHFMPRVEGSRLQGLLGEDLRALGVPTDTELVALYGAAANRAAPDPNWGFYLAFLCFKNAVITQGVGARLANGVASSSFASMVSQLTPMVAAMACEFLDQHEQSVGLTEGGGGGTGGSSSTTTATATTSSSSNGSNGSSTSSTNGTNSPNSSTSSLSGANSTSSTSTPNSPSTPSSTSASTSASMAIEGTGSVQAVIFDVGGVLTESPVHAIQKWEASIPGLPPRFVGVALGMGGGSSLWARLERGERTVDLPFLDEVAAAMRAPHAQRAFLHRHLRHTGGEDGAAAAAALAEAAKSIDRVAVSQLFQGLARAASRLQPHVLVVAREAKAAGLRVGILTNDFTASPAWLDEWASPADRRALQVLFIPFSPVPRVIKPSQPDMGWMWRTLVVDPGEVPKVAVLACFVTCLTLYPADRGSHLLLQTNVAESG